MGLITTSFLNQSYYIINSDYFEVLLLKNILIKNNIDIEYTNLLEKLFLIKKDNLSNLFVLKKSSFGQVLTTLIQKKELFDESQTICRTKIVKALINAQIEEKNEELNVLSSLIKKNYINKNIEELSREYDAKILKQIIINGMKPTNYLKKLNSSLTGFEQEGFLYNEKDKNWYNYNISTNVLIKLKDNKKLIKKI